MKTVAKRAVLSTRHPTRLKTDQGSDPVRLASALFTWRPHSAVLRLGPILVPIVLVGVDWSFYREHSKHTARQEAPAAISPPPEIASRIQAAPAPSNTLDLGPDGPDRAAADALALR